MRAAVRLLQHHDHSEVETLRAIPRFPLFGRICWALRAADENGQPTVVTCSPRFCDRAASLTLAQAGHVVYALLYLNALGFRHNDAAARNVMLSAPLRAPLRVAGLPCGAFTVPAGDRHAVLIDFNLATRERGGTDAKDFLRDLQQSVLRGRDDVDVQEGETPSSFVRRALRLTPA